MMGQKALAAAQILVDDLELHGHLTPEDFLKEREEVRAQPTVCRAQFSAHLAHTLSD